MYFVLDFLQTKAALAGKVSKNFIGNFYFWGISLSCHKISSVLLEGNYLVIGGFRGGAEGAMAPPFLKCFCMTPPLLTILKIVLSNAPNSIFWNCASWICPQCCMLYLLKSTVFIRGGSVGDLAPSEFCPCWCRHYLLYHICQFLGNLPILWDNW